MVTVLEKSASLNEKIKSIPLFGCLSDQDIETIKPFFYETSFSKESVIFYERDLPKDMGSKVYFVTSGCIKLVKYSSDGESTIVRLSSPGEFFGITSVLTGRSYPYSAETLADSTVLYVEKTNFIKLVEKFPHIAINIITALGEVLWFNYETHNQVVKKTDARVSKIIMYHYNRDGATDTPEGKVLNINLPHDYIASMTGIAYEESVRIVSRLKKNHQCINYLRGGKIVVTDLPTLQELAQGDENGFF